MFAIMVSGVTLWLICGAFVRDIPIVIANGATLLLAGTVLVLKIKKG
jgi:MtN3 and saliva related transmembrane protein